MIIIGVVGYIGSGKSTVCKYIANTYGFKHIDADEIAKSIYDKKNVKKFIQNNFKEVLDLDKKINVDKLRNIIFNNFEKNQLLSNFMWPLVESEIKKIINEFNKAGFYKIVIEGVGLFRISLPINYFLFLFANSVNLIKRITDRDNRPSEETMSIIKIQDQIFDNKPKKLFKINTSKSIKYTQKKVDKIIKNILNNNYE